jgi:hypothetical protein
MSKHDMKDQLLSTYLTEQKRMNKWYLEVFNGLLNTEALNTKIIYRYSTRNEMDQLLFRVQPRRFVYPVWENCQAQRIKITLIKQ